MRDAWVHPPTCHAFTCPFLPAATCSSPDGKPRPWHKHRSLGRRPRPPPSSVFLSLPGRALWRAQGTCEWGRKPVSASATVAVLKLPESLVPAVGVAQPGLLAGACDGGARSGGSQSNRGPEANPSLSPHYLPASEQGPLEGAEDNNVKINRTRNRQARKSPRPPRFRSGVSE